MLTTCQREKKKKKSGGTNWCWRFARDSEFGGWRTHPYPHSREHSCDCSLHLPGGARITGHVVQHSGVRPTSAAVPAALKSRVATPFVTSSVVTSPMRARTASPHNFPLSLPGARKLVILVGAVTTERRWSCWRRCLGWVFVVIPKTSFSWSLRRTQTCKVVWLHTRRVEGRLLKESFKLKCPRLNGPRGKKTESALSPNRLQ